MSSKEESSRFRLLCSWEIRNLKEISLSDPVFGNYTNLSSSSFCARISSSTPSDMLISPFPSSHRDSSALGSSDRSLDTCGVESVITSCCLSAAFFLFLLLLSGRGFALSVHFSSVGGEGFVRFVGGSSVARGSGEGLMGTMTCCWDCLALRAAMALSALTGAGNIHVSKCSARR